MPIPQIPGLEVVELPEGDRSYFDAVAIHFQGDREAFFEVITQIVSDPEQPFYELFNLTNNQPIEYAHALAEPGHALWSAEDMRELQPQVLMLALGHPVYELLLEGEVYVIRNRGLLDQDHYQGEPLFVSCATEGEYGTYRVVAGGDAREILESIVHAEVLRNQGNRNQRAIVPYAPSLESARELAREFAEYGHADHLAVLLYEHGLEFEPGELYQRRLANGRKLNLLGARKAMLELVESKVDEIYPHITDDNNERAIASRDRYRGSISNAMQVLRSDFFDSLAGRLREGQEPYDIYVAGEIQALSHQQALEVFNRIAEELFHRYFTNGIGQWLTNLTFPVGEQLSERASPFIRAERQQLEREEAVWDEEYEILRQQMSQQQLREAEIQLKGVFETPENKLPPKFRVTNPETRNVLMKFQVSKNIRFEDGDNLAHVAVRHRNFNVLMRLHTLDPVLLNEANELGIKPIDMQDALGDTPMHHFVRAGCLDDVEKLLDLDPNRSIRNKKSDRLRALDVKVRPLTPYAPYEGGEEAAAVRAEYAGDRPLMIALKKEDIDKFELYLKSGADPISWCRRNDSVLLRLLNSYNHGNPETIAFNQQCLRLVFNHLARKTVTELWHSELMAVERRMVELMRTRYHGAIDENLLPTTYLNTLKNELVEFGGEYLMRHYGTDPRSLKWLFFGPNEREYQTNIKDLDWFLYYLRGSLMLGDPNLVVRKITAKKEFLRDNPEKGGLDILFGLKSFLSYTRDSKIQIHIENSVHQLMFCLERDVFQEAFQSVKQQGRSRLLSEGGEGQGATNNEEERQVDNQEMQARVGEVQGQLGDVQAQVGGLREDVQAQVGGLREDVQAQVGGVQARVDEVQVQVGGLREDVQAQVGGVQARVDEVQVQVGGLREDVQAQVGGLREGVQAQVGGVQARVDEVQVQVGGLREDVQAQVGGVQARVDEVQVQMEVLQQQVAGVAMGMQGMQGLLQQLLLQRPAAVGTNPHLMMAAPAGEAPAAVPEAVVAAVPSPTPE